MCSWWLTKEDQTPPCSGPEGIDGLSVPPSVPGAPVWPSLGLLVPAPEVLQTCQSPALSLCGCLGPMLSAEQIFMSQSSTLIPPNQASGGQAAAQESNIQWKFCYITVWLPLGNQRYNKTQVIPTYPAYYSSQGPEFRPNTFPTLLDPLLVSQPETTALGCWIKWDRVGVYQHHLVLPQIFRRYILRTLSKSLSAGHIVENSREWHQIINVK